MTPELAALDAYWRAANYLTVGQIYLHTNGLLREPLRREHIKPRLLGHWGTSPGLSLLYAHMNRAIRARALDAIFLAGPGHGGPAVLANVYLEGTYSEVYPEITSDARGIDRLFRQFSTPGGVPSHVGPTTPGSIHEGGELGYVLTHAFGAVFDRPELLAIAVVGDGEAETGPLEGSWKGTRFLNAARDGAVLPVLHLNGYKISGPTVLGRASDDRVGRLLEGQGYRVRFVEGDEPAAVHAALAAALDASLDEIAAIQRAARDAGVRGTPEWPAIVLRTPKGWTGPKSLDGKPVEGTFRAHQVPLPNPRDDAAQLAALEAWMKSYQPDELFDAHGQLRAELRALAPTGAHRMSANPSANGGRISEPLRVPAYPQYAIEVASPGVTRAESTARLGLMLRDLYRDNPTSFRLFCPDETNSNRLGAVFETQTRCFQEPTIAIDERVSSEGRVMEVLSEHNCQGWLEGYVLTGRHGLFATYEAFALIIASMATQHAKWIEMCGRLPWRAPIPSLNYLLTSTCWRNDHNGFSHQGPGFMDTIFSKKGTVARVYLPPDANCLLSVADHVFKSHNYVNLVIIDKQPQLQWCDLATARQHCADGAGAWEWAGTEGPSTGENGEDLDFVLASAGDIPTLEMVAAAAWLRAKTKLKFRFVNVVDLMALFSPKEHPHGMHDDAFATLFTRDAEIMFSFHGYAGAIHQLVHSRPNAHRFHVRGYKEEGSTTTPFDMVVLNETSRYHIALDAMRRARRPPANLAALSAECEAILAKHRAYVVEHLEDLPEIRDWAWPAVGPTP
ncbi:MAG TPA: phosphoketolase family protein [Kofleriaceae bacterium]|jgi:xylulose-5-phosphate/fructose-6-phosphate phosphoketolase